MQDKLYRDNNITGLFMSGGKDKFYNMQVYLIKSGKLYAEDVAIRDIWEKDDGVFFDIYVHRLKKSFVFDAVFIKEIIDLNSNVKYPNIQTFINDYNNSVNEDIENVCPNPIKTENSVLNRIRNDLVLLVFMADAWGREGKIKDKIIYDYIVNEVMAAKNFSKQFIANYISKLQPESDDFYEALKTIKSKTPKQAERLLREIVKICRVDGQMHYKERMYLADIIYTLRENGLKIPENLI